MTVGEGEELRPVVISDVVRAGPEMEADGPVERRMIHGGHRCRQRRRCAEQCVDRLGGLRGEEGSVWVAPQVVRCDGDVDGTRRDERDELVLVDGEIALATVVPVKVAREPEGE